MPLFKDKEQDLDLPTLRVTDVDNEQTNVETGTNFNVTKQHVTSTMSRISGIKKFNHSASIASTVQKIPPDYGVESEKQVELTKVRKFKFQ